MLVQRGGVDGLEEERAEGHVVAHVQPAHEPADGRQHARIDAVVQLQDHAELNRAEQWKLLGWTILRRNLYCTIDIKIVIILLEYYSLLCTLIFSYYKKKNLPHTNINL